MTRQPIRDGIGREFKSRSNEVGAGMKNLSRMVSWILSIFLAFVFVAIGTSKLVGPSSVHWTQRFQRWGYPTGSYFVIGILEIVAGIAILIPRWRRMAEGLPNSVQRRVQPTGRNERDES